MKKSRSLLVAVAVVAVTLALAEPASATFPGKNGRIAFVKAVDNQTGTAVGNVFTVNPDGSGVKQVTFFGSNIVGAGYEGWSPDGRQLVFDRFDASTFQGQLWLVNADGANPHLLLNDPSFDDGEQSFSPDGSQIAFFRCGPIDCAIYRIQVDGSGLTVIVPFNFNPDVFNGHPAYSPDGQTIVFTSTTRDGVLSAVYLANVDGSNIRRLTPPEIEAWAPDWSPDGQKIVFSTRFFGVLDEEIWAINADGTKLTRLTNNNRHWHGYFTGPHDILPSWSPQGDSIVFERDAPDFSSSVIYTMNPDGTGQTQIAQVQTRRSLVLPVTRRLAAGKGAVTRHLRLVNGEGIVPRWGTAPN
jgi:Tol biopolymer transport system component